ncbi:unnamed protein product [Urochloa humidicola]
MPTAWARMGGCRIEYRLSEERYGDGV